MNSAELYKYLGKSLVGNHLIKSQVLTITNTYPLRFLAVVDSFRLMRQCYVPRICLFDLVLGMISSSTRMR